MGIKAIGFDLDDTLYDRGDYYRHIFDLMESTVVKSGVDFDTFYKAFQHYSDIEYEKFIRQGKSNDDYKIDRVIDTYNALGLSEGREVGIIFNALYLNYIDKIEFRKNSESLLQALKDEGYELFILTNGPSDGQRKKLNHLNIQTYIDETRWFISDEMNCSKPDEKIFKMVEESMGYSGSEILYIGDNYVNDIVGAREVGWQSILLDVHQHQGVSPDTVKIESMEEVMRVLCHLL